MCQLARQSVRRVVSQIIQLTITTRPEPVCANQSKSSSHLRFIYTHKCLLFLAPATRGPRTPNGGRERSGMWCVMVYFRIPSSRPMSSGLQRVLSGGVGIVAAQALGGTTVGRLTFRIFSLSFRRQRYRARVRMLSPLHGTR